MLLLAWKHLHLEQTMNNDPTIQTWAQQLISIVTDCAFAEKQSVTLFWGKLTRMMSFSIFRMLTTEVNPFSLFSCGNLCIKNIYLISHSSFLYKRPASQKIWGVEELETLHMGTNPRTSHLQLPGGEALNKDVLSNLPWKDERGPSSVRWTLEPFQRQHWGSFWETGWSSYIRAFLST